MIVLIGKLFQWFSTLVTRFQNKYKISLFATCGKNVSIEGRCEMTAKNICCGDNVYIGPNACFLSSDAKIHIGNHVMFGPNVMIATGNHRTDMIGKLMMDVHEKLPDNDEDVIIEDDCWIGMGVIILKGVTIGKGSVIGAGTVVTKSIPAYSVVYSSSKLVIKERFSKEQICLHEQILSGKG